MFIVAVMPIRLENMVTANLEDNSNQPDLKDNIEWLSHGLKETLKLHCGQARAEFGHNVMSTIMATSTNSIITKDDVSPSANNNNIGHYSSRCFNNNSMALGMDSIVQNPTKTLHCSPSNKRTPVINIAKERHVSKLRSASPNHLQKWVHQNNRVNKRGHMRRRRKSSHINNNIYIEDVRLGIRGKNTDYYHHQKFLSAQTLIQEAVKRLCAIHNNNNNNTNNGISPNNNNINNSTSRATPTPGGVDITNNGSNIINNNSNGHQQHSLTTFCNFNISTGNSLHMGLAGVV